MTSTWLSTYWIHLFLLLGALPFLPVCMPHAVCATFSLWNVRMSSIVLYCISLAFFRFLHFFHKNIQPLSDESKRIFDLIFQRNNWYGNVNWYCHWQTVLIYFLLFSFRKIHLFTMCKASCFLLPWQIIPFSYFLKKKLSSYKSLSLSLLFLNLC